MAGIWKTTFPDLPFDYYYQDAVFDDYFDGFTQVSDVMTVTSIVMIIISVSGIFGLALLIPGKKMKELSIRKVLGAGIGNISFQIIKEFLLAIGIAFLMGVPIYYLLIKAIFDPEIPESQADTLLPKVEIPSTQVLKLTSAIVGQEYSLYINLPGPGAEVFGVHQNRAYPLHPIQIPGNGRPYPDRQFPGRPAPRCNGIMGSTTPVRLFMGKGSPETDVADFQLFAAGPR